MSASGFGFMSGAADFAGRAAAGAAMDAARAGIRNYGYETYNSLDRRRREAFEEAMFDVLNNSPPITATPQQHSKYRRQANEALVWAEKSLPRDEYEDYARMFKKYLMKTVPQGDGRWSNKQYTHRYSHGSPDLHWSEPVLRVGMGAMDAVARGWGEPTETTAQHQRAHDAIHEELFRRKLNIPDTPPGSRRNYKG